MLTKTLLSSLHRSTPEKKKMLRQNLWEGALWDRLARECLRCLMRATIMRWLTSPVVTNVIAIRCSTRSLVSHPLLWRAQLTMTLKTLRCSSELKLHRSIRMMIKRRWLTIKSHKIRSAYLKVIAKKKSRLEGVEDRRNLWSPKTKMMSMLLMSQAKTEKCSTHPLKNRE